MVALGAALVAQAMRHDQFFTGVVGILLAAVGMTMPFLIWLSVVASNLNSLRDRIGR